MIEPPQPMPPLAPDEVLVWIVDPGAVDEATMADLEAILSADEVARARRYRRAGDARRCVVARGMLRRALSSFRAVEPPAWRFVAGEQGKPELADPSTTAPLSFNVSHTGGCVVVAVCEGERELGVDVEDIARASDIERIASRFFAPRELAQLEGLSGEAFCERFYAFWTLKEAYIKARGLGLAIALKAFWFELAGDEPRIGFGPQIEDRPQTWRFARESLGPRHRLAVALRTEGELRLRLVGPRA